MIHFGIVQEDMCISIRKIEALIRSSSETKESLKINNSVGN